MSASFGGRGRSALRVLVAFLAVVVVTPVGMLPAQAQVPADLGPVAVAVRTSGTSGRLVVVDGGQAREVLAVEDASILSVAWGGRDTVLYTMTGQPGDPPSLHRRNLTTGADEVVVSAAQGGAWALSASPDGRLVAFNTDASPPSQEKAIKVMPAAGTFADAWTVTSANEISHEEVYCPDPDVGIHRTPLDWAADARHLLVSVQTLDCEDIHEQYVVAPVRGSGAVPLTPPPPASGSGAGWSFSGDTIATVHGTQDGDGGLQLHDWPALTSTALEREGSEPIWLPNEHLLLGVGSYDPPDRHLVEIDPDAPADSPARVYHYPGTPLEDPVVTQDGRYIVARSNVDGGGARLVAVDRSTDELSVLVNEEYWIEDTAVLQHAPLLKRLAGPTRYETAVDIADDRFPDADTLVVARGDDFPDALAASRLTGARDAPLMLSGTESLPGRVRDWLDANGPVDIAIVGGRAAISDHVADQLAAYDTNGTVERVWGEDRFATAAAIARSAGPADRALVVSGERAADAMVAGPAAHALGMPLLLAQQDHVPDPTLQTIRDLGVEEVVLVGGTAALSAEVADTLADACADGRCDITRVYGNDRTATSAKFGDWFLDQTSVSAVHVNLARGDVFADAIAGGPHAGDETAPILLTPTPFVLPADLRTWLRQHRDSLTTIHVFGDDDALSSEVVAAARLAATG